MCSMQHDPGLGHLLSWDTEGLLYLAACICMWYTLCSANSYYMCRAWAGISFMCILPVFEQFGSLCVAAAGDHVAVTVPSGGTTGHNTTTLKKYDVEGTNFCLCDTWGLDLNNYKEEHKMLPALLEGWLPNNWKMEYQLRDRRTLLLANDSSRYKRRVHAVLFFITAGAVHDDAEMETVKQSFQKVCFNLGWWHCAC